MPLNSFLFLVKNPEIQVVLGKYPEIQVVLGKYPEIQMVLGKVPGDPVLGLCSIVIIWFFRNIQNT